MQAQPNVKQASLDGAADYANKPVFSEQPQQARKANQAAPVVKVTVVSEQATTPVVTTEFPVDYRLLLLSLADEYISQARLSSHVVASSIDQSEGNQYFKLIATGLACYESVLKTPHWQSSPRQEAMIRLRYATVLHEETENDRVVEDVLAKGLLLCERNRLFDLKYSMQHLLARVICNTKPKAALKHVEKAVEEAKASRHVPWIYALQFLRASLLVQQNGQDVKQALASLQSVAELARSQRDAGVCAMALIREAMLHMSLRAHDWDKEVDRVLASARAQHMNLGDQAAPQIGALIHLLNLASSFEPCQPKQLEQKRLAMLDYYDNHIHEADWPVDGIFSLPIRGAEANKLTSDTCGIFVADENGKTQLRFRWLDKQDTFALAYTLNAMVAHSKPSSQEKSRPEELLKEALKYTSISSAPREARIPLAAACEHVRMRNVLQCYVLINLAFLYCNRSNLAEASSTMASLKKLLKCPGLAAPGNVATMLTYLEAMIMHAKGKVVDALQVYQSPRLSLLEGSFGIATVKEQLRVLAALSVILIVRSPAHPSHALLRPLLDRLTPVFEGIKSTSDACERGMSPQLAAAYSLVLATSHEDRWSLQEDAHTSVLSTKKHLQVCFHVAKDMTNHLLLAAGMSFLHSQMFNGQVGDQALNSARNAQDLAKNSGSVLWACVTDGIAATAMEKNGMGEQAQKALEHGIKLAERLPGGVMDLLDAQQGE
ncbi:hypothetical protein FH972_024927 [Carpinus fangiana]|uniref:Cohesin loading factor n=1 Tax=Carpinus fangiana TaxID=176857 RepID=A0A5N6KZS9_9ROSI|nr:hypothetical protein FH972_024927 [Carpinus fangiana]